jgi:polyphenol oxidase
LPHFFTDRRGGESLGVYESFNLALHVGDNPATVQSNRKTLGSAQFMNQVHGDEIRVIDSISSEIPTCDGLITKTPDISHWQ